MALDAGAIERPSSFEGGLAAIENGVRSLLLGFDVYPHVVDGGFGPLDGSFDGDGVAFAYADAAVNNDMQVGEVLEAHFADKALFGGHHAGHGLS